MGKTTRLTLERREYIKFDRICRELEDYFQTRPDPDYITFSGSGESLLNSRIGDLLQCIRRLRPDIPVAVLTNGTLLGDRAVRESLAQTDVVLPSLDSATDEVFRRVNRPHRDLNIDSCIQGLISFRKEYRGKMGLPVFILPGYNDSDAELTELKGAIERIAPDVVQLNTLDRSGTVPGLRRASRQELLRVRDFWKMEGVEIIASAFERKGVLSYRSDTESAILETIARRPCTVDDLTQILGLHINEINKYLDVLQVEDKVKPDRLERGIFYRGTDG